MFFRRPLNFLTLIVIFLLPWQSPRAASKAETKLFSQAYEAEKRDPPVAIKLYQDILNRRNFDPDLKSAARWRLLHLHHKLLHVPEFFQTLDSLGSGKEKDKVREKLIQDLCLELNTSRERLAEFVSAVRAPSDDARQAPLSLRQFLKKEANPVFKQLAVEYYYRQGKVSAADSLTGNTAKKNLLSELSEAVRVKQYERAEQLLMEIDFSALSTGDKAEYFYLSGKIYSGKEQCHRAVIAYRQAVNYAGEIPAADRYRALAGFELYRCNRYSQAWGILRRRRDGYNEPNIHLLRLILWAEEENAEEARRSLKKMKNELNDESGVKYSPRLVEHALGIIRQTKTR